LLRTYFEKLPATRLVEVEVDLLEQKLDANDAPRIKRVRGFFKDFGCKQETLGKARAPRDRDFIRY
jgi:hypothetical protein